MSSRKGRKCKRGRRRPGRNGMVHSTPRRKPETSPKSQGKGRPTPKQSGRNKKGTPIGDSGSAPGTSPSGLPINPPGPLAFVPPGWLDGKPSPPDIRQPAAARCADFRNRLLDWVAEGMADAQAGDDTDPGPRTYAACWKGRVVEVHRRAVEAADAVLCFAGDAAVDNECVLYQSARNAVGLDEDSDARVLELNCEHDRCSDSDPVVLESRWPVTNAALESGAPDIGFVTPSTILSMEMSRHGLGDTGSDRSHPAVDHLFNALGRRLGLDPDYRRHKPIDTRRVARDQFGYLLAVRPRPRPGAKVSIGDVERFLRDHPEGTTYKGLTEHFGVSQTTMKRVIDDLNPEFVARGSADRCIRRRRNGQQLWSITDDDDAITTYIEQFGSVGREYDVHFDVAEGFDGQPGIILRTNVVRRW